MSIGGLVAYNSSSDSDDESQGHNKRAKRSDVTDVHSDSVIVTDPTITSSIVPCDAASVITQHHHQNGQQIGCTVNKTDSRELISDASVTIDLTGEQPAVTATADYTADDVSATSGVHPDVAARFQQYADMKRTGVSFIASLHEQPSFNDPLLLKHITSMYNIQQCGTNMSMRQWPLQRIAGQPVDNYLALVKQQEIEAKQRHDRIAAAEADDARNATDRGIVPGHSAGTASSNTAVKQTSAEQQQRLQAALTKLNAKR